METYRLYALNRDGHFIRVIELEAFDDPAAIDAAVDHVAGQPMELWNRGRFIQRFEGHLQHAIAS